MTEPHPLAGIASCLNCQLVAVLEAEERCPRCGFGLEAKCRVCGCTDSTPCLGPFGPCGWAEPDLCDNCEGSALVLAAAF